jgi:tyrosyl-tRNA synthetase
MILSNPLIEDLKWRGLLHQSTDLEALAKRLNEGPIIGYCGMDPTADSMHVGHLVPFLMLRRFRLAGHKPMALVGGVTGMIGDPKPDSERPLLTAEQIATNVEGLKKQLQKLLGSDDIPLINNADWLSQMSLVEYLRDVGKYFSVNVMLSKDSVTARMEREEGISFTEFSYQTLQGYDFYHLYKTMNCELQLCGADQWGNVVAGLDFIRKKLGKEAYALTAPLITKADGKKFGKSETGTVWLDAKKTSPYQFYQFWLNVEDAKAAEYIKIYSFKSREELEKIIAEGTAKPETRLIQKTIAEELTVLIHGQESLDQAIAASKALFGQAELSTLSAETLRAVCDTIPNIKLTANIPLPDLATALVETKLVGSKNLARQEISAGGIYINNIRATNETTITKENFLHGCVILRKGKRNCAAVVLI